MTIYSVQGPDGRIYDIEGPEGASDRQVIAALQRHLSSQVEPTKPQPKAGFVPNVKAGIERMKGDYYAGLAALGRPGAAEEAAAHRQKASEIAYTPEFTEHPLDFLTSVAGGSVPYMAAPLAAGAAASPLGALGAMGAAGAASAAQFTGSHLSRQLEEGRRPEDLNLGAAAAAAIPAAALDVVGFKYIPGIRTLFAKAGVPLSTEAAKGIVGRYITPALKTAGIEGGTEAGQAVLERLQAGLNITDPEARKEYFDNFVGGAVLGGALAVPGTMLEGRRRPEQAAAPLPEEAPVERERGEVTTVPPTERGEIGVAPYRAPEEAPAPETLQLGYTPTPTPNVVDLMDQYQAAQPRVNDLETQLQEAAAAGDTAKARDLFSQLQTERESLSGLKTQIEELGGVAKSSLEHAEESKKAFADLDKKIKAAQKQMADAGQLGDFDKIPKLADKLDALKEERSKLEETVAKQSELLRVQATPKGETIPMFAADQAQPMSTEVFNIPYDTSEFVGEGQPLRKRSGQASVINYGGRMMTMRNVNGVMVPFYLSTGAGGKADVAAGKWYPFFGIGKDGWINKTGGKEMANYYGSEELKQAAQILDNTVGDIREDTTVPKVSPSGKHVDFINQGLTPSENEQADTLEKVQQNIEKVKTMVAGKRPAPSEGADKAIAAKEAEIDEKAKALEALMKGGPKAASEVDNEKKAALLAELNTTRQKYYDLQSQEGKFSAASAQPGYAEKMDAAKASLRRRISELESDLRAATRKTDVSTLRESHITDVNRASEELNKLYFQLDALRGGKPLPTESPMALFQRENLIRTALVNGDKRTADILIRAQKEDERRGQRGMSDKEKLAERVQQRLNLPGTKVERAVFDEDYDATVEEIDNQINKIVAKQGNAKESYLEKAERLYREIKLFEQAAEDPEATPHQRAMARRTYEARLKEYQTILNGRITPAYNELYKLYTSLYKKEEVAPATEIEAKKRAETEAAGRAFREKSTEAKRYERISEGKGVKAAPARVARELGYETEEYQKLATAAQKKIDTKIRQHNTFVEKAKAQLEKVKANKGETSDAYKAKEAAFVKAANDRIAALNAFKQSVSDDLNTKAEELGRASPELRSKLIKATKGVKKAAAQSEQVIKSKRTAQATRKLPKLGVMSTGTEESKARSAGRQAKFEETLEKSSAIEQRERVQKALKEVNKKETKPKTAMAAAMTKAAKEKARPAVGSEIESKDLTKDQVSALENNDVKAALDSIVTDDTNKPLNRAVAAALDVMLDKTKVEVKDHVYQDGQELLGRATSKLVELSRNGGLTQEVLLHEGTHSAVERTIQMAQEDITQLGKEQQAAYRELQALFNSVKNDPTITSKNAKSNISEFAAEVMSNEKLQAQLRNKKWRLSDAFRGFVSIILRMIGVQNVNNMLDASVSAVEALMVPTSVGQKVTEEARAKPKEVGVQEDKPGFFSFNSQREAASIAPSFVAKNPTEVDRLKANFLGLAGRVQFVDRYAALSEALKKGMDAKQIEAVEGEQAEYYLRFGEQRSQYAGQFLTNGPVELVKKETKRGNEYVYESKPGTNMMQVADAIAKSKIGNDTEKEAILTALIAGERAKQVGWNKLNFANPAKVEQEYNSIKDLLNKRPEDKAMFDEAMKLYQQYNHGLLDLLVQTGTMTKDKAAELKKYTYVPFYRINKGTGEVELMIDSEHPVRIGNIKDEPQLKELVGDSSEILPIFTSSIQNTFMLTDMALRNQAVKETGFVLNKMGIASTIGKGTGPAGPSTVRFKHKGEDHFVVIDTDLYGIPASLIVKGMEGIKTTIPAAVRMLGMPADVLRKFVTRNPAYAIKQAIRDPLTAWMTTGVDGVPVLNSLKELSTMVAGRSEAERKLMQAGAISSNVLTGDKGDMEKFLKEISMGKTGWQKLMARADAFAMQGDAATRAVIYKDSLDKGMTEMQAYLRTLESMNFSRRGVSPSMQMLSVLIPFFNAQIQGLDVLYRAFTGKMPYDQQLEIRKKMLARGTMMALGTLAYAMMMEDDEAYKKAKPEERLGNWFLPTPFSDEPLRIPVPFELGYLFKSLPEAVYNLAADDERNNDATKGLGKLVMMSNPFSLPQAVKPATEVYLGKSFFGGDIESQREIHSMTPGERYRESTTELAKMIGSITGEAGLTPIKLDYLLRGYTGGLGVALVSLANPLLNAEAPYEKPSTKTSKMPFIGGLFQPVEGRGTLDAAYERMLEVQQAKGTYERMMQQGRKEEAKEFMDEYVSKISAASVSGSVQQKLGELAKAKRQVESAPRLSAEQKDEILKRIETAQNKLAENFLRATSETRLQSARP